MLTSITTHRTAPAKINFSGHNIPDASTLISAQEGSLPNQIKRVLNSSDKVGVARFLESFTTLEIPILMTNTEKDVVDSVQLFANRVSTEKNTDFLKRYIEILHKAICPDSGVGKHIKADKLELVAKKQNSILLNEVLANIKKYIK